MHQTSTLSNPLNSFGSIMEGRSYEGDTSLRYRFGFNGKEKDDETYGDGNEIDFGDRIYDGRLGRWWSIDPMQRKYPNLSPYAYCVNNPIIYIDFEGKENIIYIIFVENSDTKTKLTPAQKQEVLAKAQAVLNANNINIKVVGLEANNQIDKTMIDASDNVAYVTDFPTNEKFTGADKPLYKSDGGNHMNDQEGQVNIDEYLSIQKTGGYTIDEADVQNKYSKSEGNFDSEGYIAITAIHETIGHEYLGSDHDQDKDGDKKHEGVMSHGNDLLEVGKQYPFKKDKKGQYTSNAVKFSKEQKSILHSVFNIRLSINVTNPKKPIGISFQNKDKNTPKDNFSKKCADCKKISK